jgi:hypothetical protein
LSPIKERDFGKVFVLVIYSALYETRAGEARMRRLLAIVFVVLMVCVVALAQQPNQQKEATASTAAGSASHADRLSAKGQELVKEWFRLPGLQNRLNQPRRSSIDMFVVSGQADQSTRLVLFEGRIYIVTGGVAVPMVGGGWCWDSSDLQERLARLKEYLATQGPSWPPLPRK